MEKKYWALHGQHTSLIFEAPRPKDIHQAPIWRYWGDKLEPDTLPVSPWHATRARPPQILDEEIAPSAFPGFGFGDSCSPALLACRAGVDFSFAANSYQVTHDPYKNVLNIELHDSVAMITAYLSFSIDTHDVFHIHSRIKNLGTTSLQVQWLASANLFLPATINQIHSFHGQWSNEFQMQSQNLCSSPWSLQSLTGRTSHQAFPGAVLTANKIDWHQGACYGAHLAWSGNHRQTIDTLDDGSRQWQLGIYLAPGELQINSGEQWQAPTVMASFSPHGRNGLMQNFHAGIRGIIRWPTNSVRPRPVHINTWEAVYFDHDLNGLKQLASQAAQIGVERFILDDGWFHGRHNDHSSLGDWWADAGKYPNGLQPLAQHVTTLGMEFGLWVEPEMVNPDSDLYRAHPEWAFGTTERPMQTIRNQLALNTSLPAVQEYLFEKLNALLESLPITYLKWDMNRDLTQVMGTDGRAAYIGFVQGLYKLMQRIRKAHPHVEIESCASGGGRMDAGVMAYTHRFWTSDNTDALSRLDIQRGALQFFPPEVLGAHIGPVPYHVTGRSQSLDFRAGVALPLHLGVELDVRNLPIDEQKQLKAWIDLYKQIRTYLHGQQVWLGECGDNIMWQAHGSPEDILVFVIRSAPTAVRHSPALILPLLLSNRQYRISRIDPPTTNMTNAGQDAPVHLLLREGQTIEAAGNWLAVAGLPLPRMAAESVHIYQFKAI